LGLIYVEWTAGAVSAILRQSLATWHSRLIFIGLLSAVIGTFIFQPGNYIVADHRPNVSAPWAVLQLIKQGEWFVYWTTYVHMGSPFMQFHNSLYYYFAALLGLIIPDFFDVAEVSAYILFIASGYSMYLFASELTDSKLAGVAATIAYCGSYYRFELLSLGANFPIGALFFALWPMQFYFIERACKSPHTLNGWNLSWVAISVGAQLWNHPLHGSWMVGFGIFYATIRVLSDPSFGWRQRATRLLGLLGAHAGGALIGIYQILPVLLESSLVPEKSRGGGLSLEYILNVDLATGWEGSYISYSVLICALLGAAIVMLRYRRGCAIVAQAMLALSLAIAPHYLPFINDILYFLPLGNLVYARGAERYVYVAFGPLAALVGVFAHLALPLVERYSAKMKWANAITRWPDGRLCALIAVFILLENVPLTLRFNYKSPDSYLNDSTGRWPLVATLAQFPDKTSRVFDTREGLAPSFIYPMLTGHPSLSGHYEEAPPSFQTSKRFENLLREDLANGHISTDTANLLYQLNIGYLVTDGVDLMLPELEIIQRSDSATLWRVPFHSPIVATTNPTADYAVSVNLPLGSDIPVTVIQHIETAANVRMEFSLPERAFVQLSYSAYPHQKVILDGQRLTATSTALGLIGFWADAGEHTLTITPELSPLRRWTLAISGISALFALALMLGPQKHWRR